MKKLITFLSFIIVCLNFINARHINDLHINKMLMENNNNYIDEHGIHEHWMEAFNSANTAKIKQCSYIIFYLVNKPLYGTFHISFNPGSMNKVFVGKTKFENIQYSAPYRFGFTTISIVVVLSVLAIIVVVLKIFGKISRSKNKKNEIIEKSDIIKSLDNDNEISGEESSAIAFAIYLFFNENHEKESGIITIEPPVATYSPWAQKHLSINRVIRKK